MTTDNILKQDIIAGHLRILYKEIRSVKRNQNNRLREEETGISEEPQDGNYLMDQRYIFYATLVTSIIGPTQFSGLRTRPTTVSPGWTADTEFSSKPLTVDIPPNVTMPDVLDIVPVYFTGTVGDTPETAVPKFGLFAAAGEAGGSEQYIVKSDDGDYLTCRTFINSSEGGTDVFIAKPYKLRRTPFDGLTKGGITYAYVSNNERTADIGGVLRTQRIAAQYTNNEDIIYVTPVNDSGVTVSTTIPVTLLDLNVDGRTWVTL